MHKIYKSLDKIYLQIESILKEYNKSKVLQDFFLKKFESIFYAILIDAFFFNLNRENVKECKLPKGKIGIIKKRYKKIRKDVKLGFSLFKRSKNIDKNFYDNFKSKIKRDFPQFQKIISEIENEINMKKAKKYLGKKRKKIKGLGKLGKNVNDLIMTQLFETIIQKEKCFPTDKELKKYMSVVFKILPNISESFTKVLMKVLKKDSKKMLDFQKKRQRGFEKRLYKRYKEPIDLLQCLIKVSWESGDQFCREKLSKITNKTNNFKIEALVKLHARALYISNEILVLLKSGYSDGAFARWRSLHEIAVVSYFLSQNNNDVSKRYLDHDIIKRYKEAKDYKKYYKKLGYPPLNKKNYKKLQKENYKLIRKYGREFKYKGGWDWIPRTILSQPNFKNLEEHVKLEKMRPFYSLSSNFVHAGSRGFYRLGLMNDHQDKLLLIGPSNYGLADPMQNTSISLSHITVCLLGLSPDFENSIQMNVMYNYIKEIGLKIVKIQKQIEKEESIIRYNLSR